MPNERTKVSRITLLSVTLGFGMGACTSEEIPTEPSVGARAEMAAAKAYTAVDLGTLGGGSYSVATAINAAGQVVGFGEVGAATSGFRSYGFLWEDGVMADIGSLGGNVTRALDINPARQVVGGSSTAEGIGHAFLWEKGVMTDLGIGGATGINPAGQVVGVGSTGHAVLWAKGVVTDLGTLGGCCSQATRINAAGQVVGASQTVGGDYHAFIWEKGVMTDLGTLGGDVSWAEGINPAGQVVGWSAVASGVGDGQLHAVLWEKGVMTDLGTLGGGFAFGYGINPRAQVVGFRSGQIGGAYLWERGVVTDLGTLVGGHGSSATAINPAGQVVGASETAFHETHATLWSRK